MPGLSSASMPRSLKMASAAGESLSAIRTLGMSGAFHLSPGPVEPGNESLDVGAFHRGAAPDAKARRGRTVMAGVQRHAFPVEQGRQLFRGIGLRLPVQRPEP